MRVRSPWRRSSARARGPATARGPLDHLRRPGVLLALLGVLVAALGVTAYASVPSSSGARDTLGELPAGPEETTDPLRTLTVSVIGDSFTGGSQYGGFSTDGWWNRWQLLSRTADGPRLAVRAQSYPASGYVTRGFTTRTFGEGVGENVLGTDDVVVLFGSVNDTNQDPAEVGTAARRALARAHDRSPDALVVMIGVPLYLKGGQSLIDPVQAQLRAAAEATDSVFIDPIADGWFTGKNKRFVGGDDVHPTSKGHEHMAELVQADLVDRLTAMAEKPRPKPDGATEASPPEQDLAHSRLVAGSGGQVLRSLRGRCGTATTPQLELLAQPVRTFDLLPAPMSEILAIMPSDGPVTVLGLDADCNGPLLYRFVDGAWQSTPGDDAWYVDEDRRVHGPDGARRLKDCEDPVTVSAITDRRVRVACADGAIVGTLDGGDTWTRVGELDRVRAISYSSPSDAVALAPQSGCAAEVLSTADGGRTWTSLTCLEGARAEALWAGSDGILAQVSNIVYRSTDGGRTWDRLDLTAQERLTLTSAS